MIKGRPDTVRRVARDQRNVIWQRSRRTLDSVSADATPRVADRLDLVRRGLGEVLDCAGEFIGAPSRPFDLRPGRVEGA